MRLSHKIIFSVLGVCLAVTVAPQLAFGDDAAVFDTQNATPYSTQLEKKIASWHSSKIECSPLLPAAERNVGRICSYTETMATAKTDGAALSYDYLQTITIDASLLRDRYKGKAHDVVQNVLDAIQTKGTHNGNIMYRVVMPAGTYTLDKRSLHIYSDTWLDMSAGTTLVRGYSSGSMIRSGTSTKASHAYNGVKNVRIQGGTWKANTSRFNRKSASTMRFGHAENIYIDGITFAGNYANHMLELNGAQSVTIARCTFRDHRGASKEALQLDHIGNSTNSPGYQSYDDTMTQDVVIANCRFINLARGIGHHSSILNKYNSSIYVYKNYFYNIKDYAVNMPAVRYFSIKDNVIKNTGTGIVCSAMSGSYLTPRTKGQRRFTNLFLNISDNYIATKRRDSGGNQGIVVTGAVVKKKVYTYGKVLINNNTVYAAGSAVSLSRAASVSCNGNTLKSTYSHAISTSRSSLTALHNSFVGAKGYGLYVAEKSSARIGWLHFKGCKQGRYKALSSRIGR